MRRTDGLVSAATKRRGVVGAKPEQWTHWVLDLLGYHPGEDQVDDLFPRFRRRAARHRNVQARLRLVHAPDGRLGETVNTARIGAG